MNETNETNEINEINEIELNKEFNEVNTNKADNSTCAIVQDLLPLYHDDVCSPESKNFVEGHLSECVVCKKMADELNNEATEQQLSDEADNVLKRHARKENTKSAMVGGIVAGILMIPLIVCLICNLATGHGLSWFFIVLASLLVTASLTVTPLVVVGGEKKFLWTLGLFTVTLLLLFMVLAIYVKGNWFWLVSVPTFFGLSVFFAPVVAYMVLKKGILSKCKGLLIMLWDTLWLYAVIFVCGLYVSNAEFWRISLQETSFCVAITWIIFLIARYVRFPRVHMPKMVKAGVITVVSGILIPVLSDVINGIVDNKYKFTLTNFDFSVWNVNTLNPNIYMLIMLTAMTVGLILITVGLTCKKREG